VCVWYDAFLQMSPLCVCARTNVCVWHDPFLQMSPPCVCVCACTHKCVCAWYDAFLQMSPLCVCVCVRTNVCVWYDPFLQMSPLCVYVCVWYDAFLQMSPLCAHVCVCIYMHKCMHPHYCSVLSAVIADNGTQPLTPSFKTQGSCFLLQLSFATLCCYSAIHVDSQLNELR
jgi:hypothetical protein